MKYKITFFISKLKCNTNFEVGGNSIFFYSITGDEKNKIVSQFPHLALSMMACDSKAECEVSVDDQYQIQSKVDELGRDIRRVLILIKGGSPNICISRFNLSTDESGSSFFTNALILHNAPTFGDDCVVVDEDISKLKNGWGEYKIKKLSVPKKVELALSRYLTGLEKRSQEDRLLDCMIALEVLFDIPHELSYRLSLRCACFLGGDHLVRREIFNFVRGCYDLRSKIVHNGEVAANKIKEQTGVDSLSEVNKKLFEFLRKIFYKLIFQIGYLPTGSEFDELFWTLPVLVTE